jgi:autotransporter-associated beta strand protein
MLTVGETCFRMALAAALLVAAAGHAGTARAADATWLANPGNNNFNTGSNWSTGSVPTNSVASFNVSTTTTILGGTLLSAMQFNSGASAYTFNDFSATLTGQGIVNNSAFAPTFNVASTFTFENSATAGNAKIIPFFSFVFFEDQSSAATATITNSGSITFSQSSTAGNATIVNNAGGFLLSFADGSSAGHSTITTEAGSETQFTDNATAASARLINSGGTYDFSGTTGPANDNHVSAGSIEGSGFFFLGSNQLTVGSNNLSTTVSGTIEDGGSFGGSGASLVKAGIGTMTLTGANTYTGGTTVTGGLINFSVASNFGSGAITLNGGGLQWATGSTTDISAQLAAIGSGGATFDYNGNGVTLATQLTGVGGVTVTNSGTGGALTLSAAENYSGPTVVKSGAALALAGAGSIANSSGVTANGAFDISQTTSGSSIASLSGRGSVLLGGKSLTITNADGTFSGVIADGGAAGGTGGSLKIAGGTETLSGANTYSGGTLLSAGALRVTNNSSVGTGTVTLNGGMFQAGAAGLAFSNAFALNPTRGAIDTQVNTLTLSGTIADGSGPGTLNKIGAGTLVLSGANTYSGGTVINAGTALVGNNDAFGTGTVAMAAGTTLSFLSGANFALANNFQFSGDPSFTPPSGTAQTVSGIIANGSSPGTLDMNGGGTLILSATNTYTGATNVKFGALDISGSIASSTLTTVSSGATLTGTGTVGNTQINSGGTLVPGSGVPGTTMKVAGNLAFQAGALYLVQVNPSSVTSANVTGGAALTGAIVGAQFASGGYVSKQYTILTAAGGLGGTTFAGLVAGNLPSGVAESLSYSANNVYLNLAPAFAQLSGLSTNQQNVANTLTSYFNTAGSLPSQFAGLSRAGLTDVDGEVAADTPFVAFQLMDEFLNLMLDPFVYGRLGTGADGGGFGGSPTMSFAPDAQTVLPPDVALAYAGIFKTPPPAPFQQRWTTWAASYGGVNSTSGVASVGSSNVTASTYGFAAGMDYHYSPDTIFGFALGGAGTNWGLATGGTGRSDAFQAGLYGTTRNGPAYLAAALAFANHFFTTNRAALGDDLQANFDGQSYGARLEGGYRFAVVPALLPTTIGVTPYGALQAQDFHTAPYSESDPSGGGFGLSYAAMNATDVRTELGARFDDPTLVAGMPLVLLGRLAWAHDFVSNPSLGATFESLPGTNFTVNGAPMPQNSALVSAGAELFITPRWALLAKFEGEFAPGSQTYGGTGTLRYTW